MQATTGSEGGRVVDWEVRRAAVVLELGEVTPLRVKVDWLEGPGGLVFVPVNRGNWGREGWLRTLGLIGGRARRG